MRRIGHYVLVLFVVILLAEGTYSIYRLQRAGYGITTIMIPDKKENLRGLLLFLYNDLELTQLRKIFYLEKGLPLQMPKDGVPGAEIQQWNFTCRLTGEVFVPETSVYEFRTKFLHGMALFIDGVKIGDFLDTKGWRETYIPDISLEQGWHDIEFKLNIISYGGYLELWYRTGNNTPFIHVTTDNLRPDIPSHTEQINNVDFHE